jgi:hypothetical protein
MDGVMVIVMMLESDALSDKARNYLEDLKIGTTHLASFRTQCASMLSQQLDLYLVMIRMSSTFSGPRKRPPGSRSMLSSVVPSQVGRTESSHESAA